MTTRVQLPGTAERTGPVRRPAGADHPAAAAPGAGRAVARFAIRLVRRGALLLAGATAGYLAIEVVSYRKTYPDAAARAGIAAFEDSPAVRMLQGIPHALDTAGGYTAWDAGWVLAAIFGVWAVLVTTRLLRGEEETGRAELTLAVPARLARVTAVQMLVLAGAAALAGAATAGTMAALGTGVAGSLLFGLGVTGFAATFIGAGAVSAQLFLLRRRAVGAATAALGLAYLTRMIANSSDGRGWLRWLTPFGWLDELHLYGDNRWPALLPPLAAALLLGAAAVLIRARRDTAGAVLAGSDRRRAHGWLLGSPLGFAGRSMLGVLIGWLAGVLCYALVIGTLVQTVVDLVAENDNYRRALESMGMDFTDVTKGFLGVAGAMLGVLFALYAGWRIGAARNEESTERADHIFTRPVQRWRWLGGHLLLTLAAAALLAALSGVAIWLGAVLGNGHVAVSDAVATTVNTLPLAAFFTGLGVLTFGLLPRLTVAVPVTATIVGYLMEVLGPTLDWPTWLLNASPYHHVAYVPSEPVAWLATAVLTGLGLLAALAGFVAFERRDLAGA